MKSWDRTIFYAIVMFLSHEPKYSATENSTMRPKPADNNIIQHLYEGL
jgi:hypothetical protein